MGWERGQAVQALSQVQEGAHPLIAEEPVGSSQGDGPEIDVAPVVEVGEDHRYQTVPRGTHPGRLGQVGERPLAVVAEQVGASLHEVVRENPGFSTGLRAGFLKSTDVDIQVSVMIVVGQSRGQMPVIAPGHARGCRHVGEGPVPEIAIEPVGSVVGQEQVGVAVVVQIAPVGAHAAVPMVDAGLPAHFLETTQPVVAVEQAARSSRVRAATGQVKVQVSVRVVVAEGGSRTHPGGPPADRVGRTAFLREDWPGTSALFGGAPRKGQAGLPAHLGESDGRCLGGRGRLREQVLDFGVLAGGQHVLALLSVLSAGGTHAAALPQPQELLHHLAPIGSISAAQQAHGQAVMGGGVVGGKLNHLPQHLLRLVVFLSFQVYLADLIEGGRILGVLQQYFPKGFQGKLQPVLVLVDEAHGEQGGGLPVVQAQGLLQEFFRLVQLLEVEVSQPAVDDGRQEVLADGQAAGKFLQGLFVVELLQQGNSDVVVVDQAGFGRSASGGRLLDRGPEGAGLPQGLAGSRPRSQG